MGILLILGGIISGASFLVWLYLAIGRGGFWLTDQQLVPGSPWETDDIKWPSVSVVIPARNEAEILPKTLPALLRQDYTGRYHIFLIDDCSEDDTEKIARKIADNPVTSNRLTVIKGEPVPPGWTGKLWALQQGIQALENNGFEFLLFTDADIEHMPHSLRSLAHKAVSEQLDMVSLMAQLRVKGNWERWLIPAFVYFFSKLYPFRWVNDPKRAPAAAAGGCIFLRRESLEKSGGLERISEALIDDCALARQIKSHSKTPGGRIWLGLTREVRSLRHYNGLSGIWRMVSRTAYAQLHYSPLLMLVTVAVMALLYLVPPFSAIGGMTAGFVYGHTTSGWWFAAAGISAWVVMAVTFLPLLKWYRVSPLFAPFLSPAGILYTLMTIDSAIKHLKGVGGLWKGRIYKRRFSRKVI
jgi:hopene-associated glycosyltransferase HpnB